MYDQMFADIFACVNMFVQKITSINFEPPNEATDENPYAPEHEPFCLPIGFAISNSAI